MQSSVRQRPVEDRQQPKRGVICDARLRVFPGNRPPNCGSEKLWRSRSPWPWSPCRRKRVGGWDSGRLQLRTHGLARAAAPRPADTQVRKDPLDQWLLEDRGDDLQLAAAVGAMLHVDLEHALEPFGSAEPHWSVKRAGHLACGRQCGLRDGSGSSGPLRAQLGVGCENAVVRRAAELVLDAASALRAGDALHLACAEAAGAKHMATLDDVLARNAQRLKIKLVALRSTP